KQILRAKQVEGLTLMAITKNAQYTYYAIHDCFVDLERTPIGGTPGMVKQVWNSVPTAAAGLPCTDRTVRSFIDIDIKPNHPFVYYEYECRTRFGPATSTTDEFTCSAWGDLDGDGLMYEMIFGTDYDGDGLTIASGHGTLSPFPFETIRVSPAIY
ncbi:hypothetical protein L6R52_43470, partial [Myxococcota bacterium]|nr:hypothetical protein [Myxococcota bacterium]